MRPTLRVLVVEDEQRVAKALGEGLEAEHYDVRVASSGEEGFFLVNHEAFDCVVLDLMLPQRDGLEVLTTLRKRGLPTPVLILTAKDTINDRVRGLDSGADDYLVKPFAIPELLAPDSRASPARAAGSDSQASSRRLADGSSDPDSDARRADTRVDRERVRGLYREEWRKGARAAINAAFGSRPIRFRIIPTGTMPLAALALRRLTFGLSAQ